jgi:hypothetical protein
MKLTRRSFVASTAATALMGIRSAVAEDERIIRFGMPQDFTKIYTFVTAEYSQGQRDYISLVNGRGGVNGYKIVADVSDHANDLPRAIEAYERLKREGMVLVDPLSTPVARALVSRALDDKINLVTAFSGRSDAAIAELLDAGWPDRRFLPPAGQGSQRQEDRIGAHRHSVRERADPNLPGSRPKTRLRVRDVPLHAAGQRSIRDLASSAPRQAGLGGVLGSRRRSNHRAQ